MGGPFAGVRGGARLAGVAVRVAGLIAVCPAGAADASGFAAAGRGAVRTGALAGISADRLTAGFAAGGVFFAGSA